MVKKYTCSFCGTDVEPGTGSIHVKADGRKTWEDVTTEEVSDDEKPQVD